MAVVHYVSPFERRGPFQELSRMRDDMTRLFSHVAGAMQGSLSGMSSGVFPPLNVIEEEDKLTVLAEIPGIHSEDLDISVVGNTLTLRGERKPENGSDQVNYHRRERGAGVFRKSVTLPYDINAEAVTAECRNGVLKLVLPKAEHAKPRKITVNAA